MKSYAKDLLYIFFKLVINTFHPHHKDALEHILELADQIADLDADGTKNYIEGRIMSAIKFAKN